MDNTLTLEEILGLPNEIMKNSDEYHEFSEELLSSICEKYDTKEIKERVSNLFLRFKNVKYFYKFSIETSINITPVYKENIGKKQLSSKSQVDSLVTQKVDSILWATAFYHSVLVVSKKLTRQEAIYLVNSLIGNKTEDVVADMLCICRKTLQHIKKSCLIKLWLELETLDNMDNL